MSALRPGVLLIRTPIRFALRLKWTLTARSLQTGKSLKLPGMRHGTSYTVQTRNILGIHMRINPKTAPDRQLRQTASGGGNRNGVNGQTRGRFDLRTSDGSDGAAYRGNLRGPKGSRRSRQYPINFSTLSLTCLILFDLSFFYMGQLV